jgi:hypothetical protein
MDRFRGIAEHIARNALDGGIAENQLLEIVRKSGQSYTGSAFNCYPGLPGDQCYPLALFVSLSGKLRRGPWWYTFPRILVALDQHFYGKCRGQTREGVVITDTWESRAYEEWKTNIENMKQDGVSLEIYLVGDGGWATEIPL